MKRLFIILAFSLLPVIVFSQGAVKQEIISDDGRAFSVERFENEEVICYVARGYGSGNVSMQCKFKNTVKHKSI